jgi:formylglycine-generating enzyme required for sulfatase activity
MGQEKRIPRSGLVAATLVALVACSTVVGISDLEIGQCKGGVCVEDGGRGDDGPDVDGAKSDAPTDAPPLPPCDSDAGPTMVRAGGPSNSFCIDSTEITVKQYKAFLDANVPAATQAPECKWNDTFTPTVGGADDIPQSGVDWCDAVAYCKWAGKRLCGKITAGKNAGPVGVADLGDGDQHEWYVACSAQGQLVFPYGSVQKVGACNVNDGDGGNLKAYPVKSFPGCIGGVPGLYDMVGNVWEWFDGPFMPHDAGTDAADAQADGSPAHQDTYVKGGSFANTGQVACRTDGRGATRDYHGADVGFRCCSP